MVAQYVCLVQRVRRAMTAGRRTRNTRQFNTPIPNDVVTDAGFIDFTSWWAQAIVLLLVVVVVVVLEYKTVGGGRRA